MCFPRVSLACRDVPAHASLGIVPQPVLVRMTAPSGVHVRESRPKTPSPSRLGRVPPPAAYPPASTVGGGGINASVAGCSGETLGNYFPSKAPTRLDSPGKPSRGGAGIAECNWTFSSEATSTHLSTQPHGQADNSGRRAGALFGESFCRDDSPCRRAWWRATVRRHVRTFVEGAQ